MTSFIDTADPQLTRNRHIHVRGSHPSEQINIDPLFVLGLVHGTFNSEIALWLQGGPDVRSVSFGGNFDPETAIFVVDCDNDKYVLAIEKNPIFRSCAVHVLLTTLRGFHSGASFAVQLAAGEPVGIKTLKRFDLRFEFRMSDMQKFILAATLAMVWGLCEEKWPEIRWRVRTIGKGMWTVFPRMEHWVVYGSVGTAVVSEEEKRHVKRLRSQGILGEDPNEEMWRTQQERDDEEKAQAEAKEQFRTLTMSQKSERKGKKREQRSENHRIQRANVSGEEMERRVAKTDA
ncbi:hypothetical protein DL98DRAFT_620092 [Cadophora sp. DSE1049]|nr:hypothetical protein DL98DRAFT_620092 [Cadophora sp. DSE1049]